MRGLFVTGTDTGVGKTVVAASIAAALRARGISVRAVKPVLTGLDVPPSPGWAHDHELLARATGLRADEVAPVRFGPPVSPHLAAQLSGRALACAELEGAVRDAAAVADAVVVEGVGGLLVPLWGSYDVRAFARSLELPVVVAARPSLGTINHTLLTLEAARAAGLEVTAVVLTPWPGAPDLVQRSNLQTIARLGGVEVETLALVEGARPELLARAGASLPLERWLDGLNGSDRHAS